MKFKSKLILLLVFLPILTGSICRPEENISNQEYHVRFTIDNAGIDVNGTIEITKAEINFDPDHLNESSIVAVCAASTIETGIAIRDKHLRRGDYFDAGKYPDISLHSKSFLKHGRNKFTGEFDLTIKGITQKVTIPFVIERNKNSDHFKGSFQINRLDFNLGEKSTILNDNVTVYIDAKVGK